MLAYIPQNMSRKRSVPFRATATTEEAPLPKRTRTTTSGGSAGYRESNGGGHHTVDLFVLPRAPKSRRVASVKAQIANTSLLLAEHRQHSRSSSPIEFTSAAGEEERLGGVLVAEGVWGAASVLSGRPQSFQEKVSQPPRRESGKLEQAESCASSLSPLSSLGSEWEEEKANAGGSQLKVNTPPKIKTPVLNLVPVVDKTQSGVKQKPNKSTAAPKKPVCVSAEGYVRRMASLNARACVSAMMESGRRPYRRKTASAQSPTAMIVTPSRKTVTTNSGDAATNASSENPSPQPNESASVTQDRESTDLAEAVPSSSTALETRSNNSDKEATPDPNFLGPFLGKGAGYVVLCASPNTLTQCGIIRDSSDTSTYNAEGLLWNGDTIHPQARVYLTPEGLMPQLIVPPIRPARPHHISQTKDLARTVQQKKVKRPKAVKGDNGWYALGDPIKEIVLPHKEGSKVSRKYYAGLRRKNEELWVRDCITVKSGKRKKDKPYIAKIGSIWKENNGAVMVTLFWYYRPEEATGIQNTDFQKDELLASQHYDDNSVACIEDKCYVLGLRQYCRYHAQCKSVTEGIGILDSFSVIRDSPNEVGQQLKPAIRRKKLTTPHVFVCHRGYNHIAGRLLKSHKY